jgi:glycosyltransferase involved in cell wall biosynthesis
MRIAVCWDGSDAGQRFVRELAGALAGDGESHALILFAPSALERRGDRVRRALLRFETALRGSRAAVRPFLWGKLLIPGLIVLAAITRLLRWGVSRLLPSFRALARCDVLVALDLAFAGDADCPLVAVLTAEPGPNVSADALRNAAAIGERAALCVSVVSEVDMDDLCWRFSIPRDKARRLLPCEAAGEAGSAWIDLLREAKDRGLWQKHCLTPAPAPWPTTLRPPARPRGPLEVFLFLQTHYRGGVWETVKDLMKDLAALNARRNALRLTLGVHEEQTDVESLAGLHGVTIRRFRLSPIRPLELIQMLGHAPPWLGDDEGQGHCFFAGAADAAARADCWLALADRFSQPLAPLRPYGVFVYDLIQRRVPGSFSPLFFENVRRGMRPTAHRAGRVLVTTPQTRDDVIEEYGIDSSRVQLIPVSCNPGRRFEGVAPEPVPLPRERFLLNVTNHAPHKGAEVLVRAYARLKARLGEKAPALVVCGNGTESFLPSRKPRVDTPEVQNIRRLVEEMGLREGEELVALGMISDGQLLDLLVRAEVVVNAALYDNGTFSLVEAAWFGRKTVSSGYPASQYLCERFGVPARFFPPGDEVLFAEVLEEALSSPGMTGADMGRVKERLSDPETNSWRYAERVYDILVDLAEQGRRLRLAESASPSVTEAGRRLAG